MDTSHLKTILTNKNKLKGIKMLCMHFKLEVNNRRQEL